MKNSYRAAVTYAALSYIAWGLLPMYWKLLGTVSSAEILTHRIVWSAVFLSILISCRNEWPKVRSAFQSRKVALRTAASALCISANWILYIWGVNSGRILEASLGYFINPLVSIALGRIMFGERLRPLQIAAVNLALIGVLYSVVSFGSIPYLALGLAATFTGYGLLRKQSPLGPTDGLLAETLMLAPIGLAVMILGQLSGTATFLHAEPRTDLLLMLAGVVTSIPLLWFARGAQSLPLRTMGVLQYFSPTLQMLVAALVYGEAVEPARLVTFALIWAGLLLYTIDAWRVAKRLIPLSAEGVAPPAQTAANRMRSRLGGRLSSKKSGN